MPLSHEEGKGKSQKKWAIRVIELGGRGSAEGEKTESHNVGWVKS